MAAPAAMAAGTWLGCGADVASLEPATPASGTPAVLPRMHNDDAFEVYDFVASETSGSSRESAAYADRGPLMICSGDSNPSLAAQIGGFLFGGLDGGALAGRAPSCTRRSDHGCPSP